MVALVLASFSAMAPFWLFSTVSFAGFTLPGVMSIVAIPVLGFDVPPPFPPKLICLRNHDVGLLLESVLSGGAAIVGKDGSPLILGGVLPRLTAGDSLGVEYPDLR